MARKKRGEGRIAQIRQTYAMTRKQDPKVGLVTFGAFLGVFVVVLAIGFLLGHPIVLGILGLMLGFLAWTILFSRRAERAAYGQIAGQPGAAAAVMQTLKRGWTTTPAVAMTRNQDLVHRAVGRAGVVLVGEGAPSRVSQLIAQERKKLARVAPDVPVYDFIVGSGKDEVRLSKLQRTLMKLPPTLGPAQVRETNSRLKALGNAGVPLPKGPLPRNVRMPRPPVS